MAGAFVKTPCLKLKMPCSACGTFSSLNSDKMFHKRARWSPTCSTQYIWQYVTKRPDWDTQQTVRDGH